MMKSQLSRKSSIIFSGITIYLCFFFGHQLDTMLLSYIGIMILLISAFLFKITDLMLLVVFLLSIQRDLVLNSGDMSLINILVLSMFLKGMFTIKSLPTKLIMSSIIIIILGITSLLVNNDLTVILNISRFLIVIFTIYIVHQNAYSGYFSKFIEYYIKGLVVFGIFSFINYLVINSSSDRFLGGLFNDPNIYGTQLIFGITLLLFVLLKHTFNIKILLAGIVLLFFGLFTMSRAFVFSLAFLIIFMFLSVNTKIQVRLLLTIALVIVVFSIITYIYPTNFITNQVISLYQRIENPRQGDISGGRLLLWRQYISYFTNYPQNLIFGIGDNYTFYGMQDLAHNFIIDSISIYGLLIFNTILVIYYHLYQLFRKSFYQNKKLKALFFLPLFILIVSNITLYDIMNLSIIMQFIIAIYILTYKEIPEVRI